MVSAAILYSGNTYTALADFSAALDMQFLSKTTYNKIQKNVLLPVVQEAWTEERKGADAGLQSARVIVAGDCRCDSPGHNAKYGSYSLMSISNRKIVALNLVQVSEVNSFESHIMWKLFISKPYNVKLIDVLFT
jgi:hypothetical protein